MPEPSTFVSYSHEDHKAIKILRTQLRVLEAEGLIAYWDDSRLSLGEDWFPSIKAEIEKARIAIFLISAASLSSKFIRAEEIPPLLEKRLREGLWIIPVLIDDCPWQTVPWLAKMQLKTDGGKPITGMQTRKRHFAEIARQIAERVRSTVPAPTTGVFTPRAFHPVTSYIPGSDRFEGRKIELDILDKWAIIANKPVLLFEAIGGMGKSFLIWQWVREHAPRVRHDWAGRFWYSFYEAGANMDSFCVHALAYVSGMDKSKFEDRRAVELRAELLEALHSRPWLLVLDGAERLLVEYDRYDAAQLREDRVENKREKNSCIRSADDDLLRQLSSSHQSKILISSRNTPAALSQFGAPIAGVQHEQLKGLYPEDAEKMLVSRGVRGDSGAMRRFLEKVVGGHPLVIGFVAGLIANHFAAPKDFDHWSKHADLDFTNKGLKARHEHILSVSFRNLSPEGRTLLARMGLVSDAMTWEEILALNPHLPERPPEVNEPSLAYLNLIKRALDLTSDVDNNRQVFEREIGRVSAQLQDERKQYEQYRTDLQAWEQSEENRQAPERLQRLCIDLRERGLLQWDQSTNKSARFDLHPVVRGFAIHSLSKEERAATGERVADYFNSQVLPDYKEVTHLGQLRNLLHTINSLLLSGNLKRASALLVNDSFVNCLRYRLERCDESLALLKPFFLKGWSEAAPGLEPATVESLARDATAALLLLGRPQEALTSAALALEVAVKRNGSAIAACGNYMWALQHNNRFREMCALLPVTRGIVEADSPNWIAIFLNIEASYAIRVGDLDRADRAVAAWAKADMLPNPAAGDEDSFLIAQTELRILSSRQIEEDFDLTVKRLQSRPQRRYLLIVWGDWHYQGRRWQAALDRYREAVNMAREVRFFELHSEALVVACQARLGNLQPAEDLVQRLDHLTPVVHGNLSVAELYLAIGDLAKAHKYALSGYQSAWGKGAPYANSQLLERCRRILKELKEPEPELPPFDSTRAEPVKFEAELSAYLEELRKRKPTKKE